MTRKQQLKVAKEAYRLLESVPAENFFTGAFTDEKNKCCALGHLIRLTSPNPDDYSLRNCNDFDLPELRPLWATRDEDVEKIKIWRRALPRIVFANNILGPRWIEGVYDEKKIKKTVLKYIKEI